MVVLGAEDEKRSSEAHLGFGPTTVCLSFCFVKVFFVGLDFHREDVFLEFLPLGVCFGRVSVVLMWVASEVQSA